MKIGVFDSGVGGLTVLKSLLDSRLFSEIIYYGDTARVPYGNKDKGTITRFSLEALDFFAPFKIDMLVVGCNTVSAYALKAMQEVAPFPIVGVIEAGVLSLSHKVRDFSSRILIIGTKATINSGIYERNLRKLGYQNIISLQTGLFVPLVEEGILDGAILDATFRHYFEGLGLWEVRDSTLRGEANEQNNGTFGKVLSRDFKGNARHTSADRINNSSSEVCEASPLKSPTRRSQITHPLTTSAREGESNDSFELSPTDFLKKSKQKTLDLGDSGTFDKVLSRDFCGCEAVSDEIGLDAHRGSEQQVSTKITDKTKPNPPDAVILGCTHFPLIANQIRAYFDNKPILIHSGDAIVEFLAQKYTLQKAKFPTKVRYYASGDKSTLEFYAKLWLKS